ncbi:MAG: SMP-30/gluconolactonase/LRE family protein [Vicinamibacteria bacterium]
MKKVSSPLLLVMVILGSLPSVSLTAAEPAIEIVRLDPRFDEIVPRDAKIEKLADGFAWVEGPAWDRKGGYLLFSDIPNNSVFKWKEGEGATLFLRPSGYTGDEPFAGREPGSNGLTFDPQGRLVLCEHGDRRISRLEADGSKTTLVDRYQGKRLNSPNDVVFKSNGDMYFTDPPFGLPGSFDDPSKELDFQGVYRFSADGTLTLLTKALKAPNGIAFSPDEKTLYVSDSGNRAWMAFDVENDGTIANGRVLLDAQGLGDEKPGVPDGLKVDSKGNLFGGAPGGLYVIAPDGTLLGKLDLGVATGNCAWGEDGSTLFITSNTAIYRIRLNTKGAGL